MIMDCLSLASSLLPSLILFRLRMFLTVVRSKCHGVQMHGDHMFWGTKIVGPAESEVHIIPLMAVLKALSKFFPSRVKVLRLCDTQALYMIAFCDLVVVCNDIVSRCR